MPDVKKYVSFQLPIPLAKQVDKLVKNEKHGYRSRNEFCVEAIRTQLRNFLNNGGD